MGADFRRSQRFGVIGVVVVAILAAAIGLLFGNGANPTAALAVILALVFAFVATLLVLQRRDLDRAEVRADREAFAAAGPVDDPTLADSTALLHALALAPVDDAALAAARRGSFAGARDSIGAGARMVALIFCAVVPWQLFQFVWSLVVFVPLIVAYAIYLSARALGPSGTLEQGYEQSAATLEPLGLALSERPRIGVRRRLAGPGAQTEISGALVFAGKRHGRAVEVRLESDGTSTVELAAATAPFTVAAKGERLRAGEGATAALTQALQPLRASSYWRGVRVESDGDEVRVRRRRGGGEHWMRDLWLAEHLAAAAGPTAGSS